MQGHRRLVVKLGDYIGPRVAPSGGYSVSCLCGWSGGVVFKSTEYYKAYSDHLKEVESRPRECRGCKETKPPTEFNTKWSRYLCIKCYYKMGNDWSLENPQKAAVHKRNHHLEKTFGMTQMDFDSMLKAQGGVCAICSTELQDKRGYSPHIDHCHSTGIVRGILCFNCNAGLGMFKDNIESLKLAILYLEFHSEKSDLATKLKGVQS